MLESTNERHLNDRLNELDREWQTHWAQLDREWQTRNVRVRQLQNDLDRVDREWAVRKKPFMAFEKDHEPVPSLRRAVAEVVAFTTAGIFFIACVRFETLDSIGLLLGYLLGLACIGVLVLVTVLEYVTAVRFQRAKAAMKIERSVLLVQVENAQRRVWESQQRRE
ncbi:hypothetical protein [Paraliomyxa miuraensis]|uniref:hypothetical protein n=1 Tax=Paraliomyxa miuraensis TaxID=376150 RepID=UPI00224EFF90|nr:hypothetical protein [Paraliomyxa miuraensis]MCX4244222.1 hypothetical protein [Paraliomyxa miuraensis]